MPDQDYQPPGTYPNGAPRQDTRTAAPTPTLPVLEVDTEKNQSIIQLPLPAPVSDLLDGKPVAGAPPRAQYSAEELIDVLKDENKALRFRASEATEKLALYKASNKVPQKRVVDRLWKAQAGLSTAIVQFNELQGVALKSESEIEKLRQVLYGVGTGMVEVTVNDDGMVCCEPTEKGRAADQNADPEAYAPTGPSLADAAGDGQ